VFTPFAAYGIYLTTMRSAFIGLAAASMAGLAVRIPIIGRTLAKANASFFVICSVAAPYLAQFFVTPRTDFGGSGVTNSRSLMMRIFDTWPDMLERFHEPVSLLLGLGLGNVGVPQKIFNPAYYNPADNFGLYIFAVFGGAAFLFHIFLLVRIFGSRPAKDAFPEDLFIGITGLVYAVGFALNCIESIPLGMSIGVLTGLAFRKLRR
jgi:hypothetical protein